MNSNSEKLKKSVELEEKYGTDPDEIMLMEDDEFASFMGISQDIYSYESYLERDYKPDTKELVNFTGPTLSYVKFIISSVKNIDNLNTIQIENLYNILLDLKIKFNDLKTSLEIDKKLDEEFIKNIRDIYTKEEYRREELAKNSLLILRCDTIINALNQNIQTLKNYTSRSR